MKTVYSDKCLTLLFSDDLVSDNTKVIKTISNYITEYITRLVWTVNRTILDSPIRLLGSVTDSDRAKRYYPSTISQEMKWVVINNETTSNNASLDNPVFDQLFQLLKNLISHPLSLTVLLALNQYILSCYGSGVQYAYDDMSLLNLIYCNQQQLSTLLQATCFYSNSNLTKQFVNIMNLLQTNCNDFICWKQPLIDILNNSSQSNLIYCDILFDLMNRFCQKDVKVGGALEEGKGINKNNEDYEQLIDFVTQGTFVYNVIVFL